MTGLDSTVDPIGPHVPVWRDIRTLGPVLLVVFGLVLALTPMASVGVTGSVGNAGIAEKGVQGCPTQEQIDSLVELRLQYEADPSRFIGIPLTIPEIEELVANCSCDLPYGNAGNAGIVDPCDRQTEVTTTVAAPPATDPPATDPPATDPPATDPPATEPTATEPPAGEPATTPAPPTDGGASPVPPPGGQLPATGNDVPIGTAGIGFLLAALGGLLLVTARRRTSTP